MQETICQAIRSRRLLAVVYDSCARVVEPYALYPTKADKIMLDSRQVGGKSQKTSLPDWCMMSLSDFTSATLLEESFQPDADYKPNSPRYKRALCRM